MEFFVVMTLAKPIDRGMTQATRYMTVTAQPGATREGLYAYALTKFPESMEGGNVLFFSAEPNALAVSA